MPDPKPRTEPSRGTPTLREDLVPPIPVVVPAGTVEHWDFVGAPVHLLWNGEGERCEATYPPGQQERSVRCELVGGHWVEWPHLARRSSV